MSTIFYSQVNRAVQQELIKRGSAGVSDRSTDAIRFMVEKIANVQLNAFEKKPSADITMNNNTIAGLGLLGGLSTIGKDYLPAGYLNDKTRPANRTKPYINNVSISINDQSKSYINKAVIQITVPDATTDIDEMERIYCKPGRYILIRIQHPDSAILSDSAVLADDRLPSTEQLKELYPNVDTESLRKMNELYFQGRISTFSYNYTVDGAVVIDLEAIGTSSTYGDITIYLNNNKPTNAAGQPNNTVPAISNLYTTLYANVEDIVKANKNNNVEEFEYLEPGTTDQGILVGTPYIVGNTTSPNQIRMVSLGYLINHVNTQYLKDINSTNTNASIPVNIICNDTICESNLYERLVSANPMNVMLWQGKSSILSSTYKSEANPQAAATTETEKIIMFPKVEPASAGFSINTPTMQTSYPSRIYINLEVIRDIIDSLTDFTLKAFLQQLSDIIKGVTGGAIILALLAHPTNLDAMLYYDTQLVSPDAVVQEFTLPVFANITGATVVRSFTLTSNVPNSIKNMVFGIDSAKTGTQQMTAYNPYVFGDSETRQRLAEEWKINHTAALKDLSDKKYIFAQRPTDSANLDSLQKALEKYITWFTPDINESIKLNKSIFPMDLEFEIDGINGFKFGDVLNFAGLPRRYTDSFVFTVLGIMHSVSDTGEWVTSIKCNPRVRITGT
jgi:hypothetical protein